MDREPGKRRAPLGVFVSYADGDEKWRDKLLTCLRPLERDGLINIWHRGRVLAGESLEQQAHLYLETCPIILLLLSPKFLAMDSGHQGEMQRAIERQKENDVHIIPIGVVPCDWKHSPLASLQCLPRNGKTVKEWHHQDAAWKNVVEDIRRTTEHLRSLSGHPTVSSSSSAVHIPYSPHPFFTGRENELAELRICLGQNHHIQAISGLGGIGKTELAIEYAYRYQNDYHIVLWAQANSLETLTSSYSEIATLLNLPGKDTREQDMIVQAVKIWLQNHQHYLLILDNVEKPALLGQFIPHVVGGHLLITTQDAHLSLPDLGIIHSLPLERFTPEQGVHFLRRILEPKVDLAKARQLVETLSGLPLALDQAGAYLRTTHYSLAAYLALYEQQRAQLLQHAFSNRSRTSVTTTFTLSFQKVADNNPAAADLLRLCAFLAADTIPRAMFKQGTKALGTLLASTATDDHLFNLAIKDLRNYSLIERNQDEDTLTIHPLVQDVLRESLPTEEQQRWKLRAVRVVNATLPGLDQGHWTQCEQWLPHTFICDRWIKEVEEVGEAFSMTRNLFSWIGNYLRERARYDEAKPYLEHALGLSESTHKATFLAAITDLSDLAYLHWNSGGYKQAEKLLLRAQAIYEARSAYDESLRTDEELQYTEILQNLACTYQTQGKYKAAEELFQQALQQRNGTTPLTKAIIQSNQAELYRRLGRHDEADLLLEDALCIHEKELDFEDLKIAYILHKQALLFYDQGRYSEAKKLFEGVLERYRKHCGPEHPNTAQILHGLAEISRVEGKYEEAEKLFEQALTMKRQKLGDEHSSIASILNGLALLYLERGKYIYVKPEGQKGYMKQGRYQEAEELLQDALAIRESCLGPQHPDTAICLYNLGLFYTAQEMYQEAEIQFKRALDIWQQQLSFEHPYLLHARYHLGHLAQAQGDDEKADEIFQEILKILQRQYN